jgi:DNA helicase-2/ATP-dependent DNA helicase PcrA
LDAWIDIRRKARACHAKAMAETGGDRRAEKIIAAALKADRLKVEPHEFPAGTLGSLNRAFRLVRVKKGWTKPGDQASGLAAQVVRLARRRCAGP